MKTLLSIAFLLYVTITASAQVSEDSMGSAETISESPFIEYEDSLKVVAANMIAEINVKDRIQAREDFTAHFVHALELENSFDYPFDSIQSISIVYPKDRSFRFITWQLCLNSNEFQYFGYIQMNSPALKLIELTDNSDQVIIPEKEILDAKKWYGSLVYNIKEVGNRHNKYYLIFGFDANDLYTRKKLVDVLMFEDGMPKFGAPVFVFNEENRPPKNMNRFILEYSASSAARLNYDDDLGMIVYDNLIPMGGQYEGQGVVMVPDGSYRGLKLSGGIWSSVDKLFHQTQDEAPRPNPILDNRKGKNGLFGPEKN